MVAVCVHCVGNSKINVVLSDCDDQTEGAIDAEGPLREMFPLVFYYFKSRSTFCGPSNYKLLSLDKEQILYYETGKLMAGCWIRTTFLFRIIFTMLAKGTEEVDPALDNINDMDIKNEI